MGELKKLRMGNAKFKAILQIFSKKNPKKLESEEVIYNLENIISNMPGYIYWKNCKSEYMGCNQALATISGLNSPDEIIGKTDYDFEWGKNQAKQFIEDDQEVIRTKTKKTGEHILSTLDAKGRHIVIYTEKMPLYNIKSEIIGILAIAVDITEKKMLETREKLLMIQAAEEKASAQAETEMRHAVTILAGSIAHDLRNPLTGAIIQDNLLSYSLSDLKKAYENPSTSTEKLLAAIAEHLQKADKVNNNIYKGLLEMNGCIDHSLQLIKHLVTGTLSEEDFVVCEIEPVLNEVLAKYAFTSGQKKLIHIKNLVNFSCLAIPVLLYRIFNNLLKNAFEQIAKQEKGEIFISSEIKENDVNILRFRDTAGGVSAEMIGQFFEGFKTTKENGTGIGLAFCKLTMERFNGSISCALVGEDIEFILSYPILKQEKNTWENI